MELTTGSKRWNDIMNGKTSNTIDNLLTVDLKTNIHEKDVENIKRKTGYKTLNDDNLSFFKECKLSHVVKAITFQEDMDQKLDHRIDIDKTFIETDKMFKQTGSIYLLDKDGELNSPPKWYRSKNYHRIVIDLKYCKDMKLDWDLLLDTWRAFLSNKYAVSCRKYKKSFYAGNESDDNDDNILIMHVFTVIPAIDPTAGLNEPKHIAQGNIWGKSKYDTKRKSTKMEVPNSTLLVYENPDLCTQQIFYNLFERIFQENKVRAIDKDSIPQSVFTEIDKKLDCDSDYEDDDVYADNDEDIDDKYLYEMEQSELKRVSLNMQSTPVNILKYIYQFLLRPDILPCTTVLINVEHTYKIFGLITARNQLVVELKKVLDDLGSAVDRHHIELVADFISFKGILLPLTRKSLKIMNTNWVTNGKLYFFFIGCGLYEYTLY
jgi:hypothetical protein